MIAKVLGQARIKLDKTQDKLRKKLSRNPLNKGANFHLHSHGHAICDSVVAIKKPAWQDPFLFELPSTVKISAHPDAVRIEDGNIILKRGNQSEVVFDGRKLRKISFVRIY